MATSKGTYTHFKTAPTQDDSEGHQKEPMLEDAEYWSEMVGIYFGSGQVEAALRARQNAVHIYRQLYEVEHNLYEGLLARELLELSKNLESNGRIEEAFETSQESGKRYRHIIARRFPSLGTGPILPTNDTDNQSQADWQITRLVSLFKVGSISLLALITSILSFVGAYFSSA